MCLSLFLIEMLFIKKRLQHRRFPVKGICEVFKNAILHRTHPLPASVSYITLIKQLYSYIL